jgi:hypothetical protein
MVNRLSRFLGNALAIHDALALLVKPAGKQAEKPGATARKGYKQDAEPSFYSDPAA